MGSTFRRTTARVPLLPLLVLGFLCCALALLAAWGSPGRSLAVGDEPHYLVLADGLVRDTSLSPEQAYVRAASDGLPSGVTPRVERVLADNAVHLVQGPHGWYSVHGVGLAAVIAPAVLVGHEFGARLVMLAIGAAIVAIVWALAGLLVTSAGARLLAVVPLCIALPVVVSSTQIYPDLPGGALCLLGLLAVMWAEAGASSRRLVPCAVALALLPWLHLRFAMAAVVLVAALAWAHRRSVVWLVGPLAVSAAALVGYHWWAFGSLSGPYGDDAVAVGWRSVMVLVGLGVDQNQGLVMQQPLHLVGLFFLVPYVRAHRLVAGSMLVVIASIVLPSSVHPAWYGGPTFSGRFGWAPSLVFLPATLFGLGALAEVRRRLFLAVVAFACALQAWYVATAWRIGGRLYQRPDTTPLDDYSIHFGALGRWLPALYDPDWAFGHVPNAVALLTVVWLVALGAAHARSRLDDRLR